MRHSVFAVCLCLFVPIRFASAQDAAPAATQEGLRAAETPRHFEPPSPAATVQELDKRGDELRGEKAYQDAIDYYLAALGKTSDHPVQASLFNKMGVAQLQMRHYREAERSFGRALKKQRDFAEARNNLGAIFYVQKKYSRAIEEYTKAIKLDGAEASFYNNLGTAYFASKDYPRALAEYSRAIQLDPEIFHRKSRVGVAAQISSPGDRASFAYLLAKTYAHAGDNDSSLEYLRKAIEDGYRDINHVYQDQDFAILRKDPRFSELMATKPKAIQE